MVGAALSISRARPGGSCAQKSHGVWLSGTARQALSKATCPTKRSILFSAGPDFMISLGRRVIWERMAVSAKDGGNKRQVNVREVVNGIMYILSTGCQWRAVPKDLPPRSALFDYLDLWSLDGTLDRMHHALSMLSAGRPMSATRPGSPNCWPTA
jgi:transposase